MLTNPSPTIEAVPAPAAPTLPPNTPPDLKALYESLLEQIKIVTKTGIVSELQKLIPPSDDLDGDGLVTPTEKFLRSMLMQAITFAQQSLLEQQKQTENQAKEARDLVKRSQIIEILVILAGIIAMTLQVLKL